MPANIVRGRSTVHTTVDATRRGANMDLVIQARPARRVKTVLTMCPAERSESRRWTDWQSVDVHTLW
jgi:hypothetical protein